MATWQPLAVYDRHELTLAKFQELAKALEPFAVRGVDWEGMKEWADPGALVEAHGLAGDVADVMMFEADGDGDVEVGFDSEAPLGVALGMMQAQDQGMYVKYALPCDSAVLASLPFKDFLVERTLAPAEQPMLLKPGRYFTWLYAGTAGSGSATHIDVMNSSAWLTSVSGEKQWLLAHGEDYDALAKGGTPNLFSHFPSDAAPSAPCAAVGDVDAAMRLYHHRQAPGTAMFVPSRCWHAVKNLTPCVSLTHNFVDATNQPHWEAAVKDFLNVQ
eukprot:TRINITY_DN24815_c0_g1_i1.p2 TRINITY_DN24815_c0_g1~~TRINITY_DN24815_c0_g1_i1.p2  ORF type:complete len:292 (+),score=94.57 TRINITY_DN24815_c0_g1_i1:60-878(+)